MNCGNLDPTRILRPPFAPVFSPTVRVGPIKPYALGVRDEEAKFSFQFHALLTAFYFLGFLYRCVSISVSREWNLSWLLSLVDVHSPAHAAEPARPRSHKAPLLTPVACSKGLLRVTRSNAALPATLRAALCVAVRGTMLALQRRARAHALVRSCSRNTCEAQIEASGGARTTSGVVRRTIALGSGSCWRASQSCLVQRLLIEGHSDRSTGDRSGAAAESCDSA